MGVVMEIKRDVYLNRLIVRKHNGFIKVITGIRRSGKSYLLNTLFYNHLIAENIAEDHIIKFAFDSADDLLKIGEDPIVLDNEREDRKVDPSKFLNWLQPQIADKEMHYILLDEVQLLNEFEDVLNSLLHIRNADVYVTGSNSKFLSSDIITEFRGRGDEIRVYPLSFREYMSAYNGTRDEAWDDYFNYGGLPLILSMPTDEDKANYLSGLFKKVYISDIVDRHKVRNKDELDELVDILASATGSLTNPTRLARTFRSVKNKIISDKTLKTYTDYLIDAFLVSKAVRFDVKGKKYIGSPVKYYFEDVGLRNARLNFRQMEENHIMENIIYNELRIRGYHVDVGLVEQFGKNSENKTTKKQLEVDFVVTRGSEKYYIQSAFAMNTEGKREQEERPLNAIGDSFKKIIIVRDNIKVRRNDMGIVTIGVRNFLLDEHSLSL